MLRFFWGHYRSHVRSVLAAALATAVAAIAEGLTLVALVSLATRATDKGSSAAATLGPVGFHYDTLTLFLITGGLLVISAALRSVSLWLRARTVSHWERVHRVEAVHLMLDADYEHVAQLSPAELQGVVGLVSAASGGLMIIAKVVNAALSFVVLVSMAFVAAPLTALVLALVGGMLVVLQRPLGKLSREGGKKATTVGIESGRLVNAAAREGREIRLFGAQVAVLKRFRRTADEFAVLQRRLTMISGLAPLLYQTLGMLFVIAALGVALSFTSTNITVLGAVALLFIRSLSYGQQLSSAQQEYHQMVPSVERLDRELAELREARAEFGEETTGRISDIQLVGVSYRYPGAPHGDEALHGVTLEFSSPGVVGLAGKSGSGKSTLAQLLLRLRHATEGSMLVNGQPIDMYSARSWTEQVALVPQYPDLVRGTVRENIAFFREGFHDAEMRRVADSVGLDAFFSALPLGYDTELGEAGRDLSGGQLQRLGIARALVGNPSLLVLDEPTSALDLETEEWVQRAIHAASERALVIIISHRPSTLELCNRVIRLQDGHVVADDVTRPDSTVASSDAGRLS